MKSQSEQKESQSKWSAADLCLPIYLDQLIVFDMLAVLERIVKLMELAKVFQNPSTTQAVPKRGKISNNQHPSIANPQEEMYQQLRNFHEQMTKSDSIEVKGKKCYLSRNKRCNFNESQFIT